MTTFTIDQLGQIQAAIHALAVLDDDQMLELANGDAALVLKLKHALYPNAGFDQEEAES